MGWLDDVFEGARAAPRVIDTSATPTGATVGRVPEHVTLAQQYMDTVFGGASRAGSVADVKPKPYRDLWHKQAFPLIKAVPEVAYVLNMRADLLARCRVTVERRVPDGNGDDWEETDDARPLRVLRDFHGAIGGPGAIVAQGSFQSDAIGEAWLFGDPVLTPAGRLRRWDWSFKSMTEVLVERPGAVKLVSWGANVGEVPLRPGTYLRHCLFNPDPQFSMRSTSPVFNILPLMMEMVSASGVIDAILRSQIHAGMFFMPQEVSFGPTNEWDNPGTPAKGFDEAEEEMIGYMSGAVSDPTSVNRIQPLLMWGPGVIQKGDKSYPTKDLMGLVPLSREFDDFLRSVRVELIERIARALNVEPEILMGLGSSNHFSGWLVQENFINQDCVPVGESVLAHCTANQLRPMLQMTQGMSATDAEWFRYSLDPSPILSAPDKTNAATAAYNMGRMSDGRWLEYMGLDPELDLPTPEEYVTNLMERLVLAQPSVAPNVVPWLNRARAVMADTDPVDLGDVFDDWTVGQSTPGGAGYGEADVRGRISGPGEPPSAGQSGRLSSTGPIIVDMVTTVADRALRAAIGTAQVRLVTALRAAGERGVAARLASEPVERVLTVAGESAVMAARVSRTDLFAGAFDELTGSVVHWLVGDLVRRGVPESVAVSRASVAANELATQLEALASSSFDRPLRPGPNGLHVGPDVVSSALAAGDLVDVALPVAAGAA
jgi:hypothetical protein